MDKRPSQNETVLALLRSYTWVTLPMALQLGIARLASRVNDLRRRGHVIEAERAPGKSWGRYRLVVDAERRAS